MVAYKLSIRGLGVAVAVLVALFAADSPANASDDQPARLWMAAASEQPGIIGTDWGRLILKDGILSFQSAQTEWSIEVAGITRVEISKESKNQLEVEYGGGNTYYVAILKANLLVESPGKAVGLIREAMGSAVLRGR